MFGKLVKAVCWEFYVYQRFNFFDFETNEEKKKRFLTKTLETINESRELFLKLISCSETLN